MSHFDKLTQTKVLKIGGSVLTRKDLDSELNHEAVNHITSEIGEWLQESEMNNLIFVSGAGSYGHPLARTLGINSTYQEKSAFGFVATVANMQKMGSLVASAFHRSNVPVLPISSCSVFVTDQGRIVESYLEIIVRALRSGLVPFLWGDATFDLSHTYRILSGDQINAYLCDALGLGTVLFGSKVDGIYTADPLKSRDARRIPLVSDENYHSVIKGLAQSDQTDVTGGMRGKVEEIRRIRRRPLKCLVFNALVKGNTYKALHGEEIGTTIAFA